MVIYVDWKMIYCTRVIKDWATKTHQWSWPSCFLASALLHNLRIFLWNVFVDSFKNFLPSCCSCRDSSRRYDSSVKLHNTKSIGDLGLGSAGMIGNFAIRQSLSESAVNNNGIGMIKNSIEINEEDSPHRVLYPRTFIKRKIVEE